MANGSPRMIALGYGKFVRADRVFALVPLEADERGEGPGSALSAWLREAARDLGWHPGVPLWCVAVGAVSLSGNLTCVRFQERWQGQPPDDQPGAKNAFVNDSTVC